MTGTAALFHHPDAVEGPDTPLSGRRAAGQSFLSGLIRHESTDRLHAAADSRAHLAHFRALAADLGWTGEIDETLMDTPAALAGPGTLMLPGPGLGRHAWRRRRHGAAYSLCGVVHTVATRRMMDEFSQLATAPVAPWDAIVCTSHAVRDVLTRQFDATEAWLRDHLGATRVPRPQLPVIPLGIDTARVAPSDAARRRWRQHYAIPEDGIAVLSMGRLSVFEKMHPLPLLLALQQAAERAAAPVTLLMAGWFPNDAARRLHAAAAECAPAVTVHFPDGTRDDLRTEIWSAADIFALPVDNIQETFGLAPVEAMAAGLPVVCSDWNGFRDTVEDDVTGYRIRTLMTRPGLGDPLAERFEQGVDGYLQYLGQVQQQVCVDVRQMAEALGALIADADLRRRMGAAGRARAARLYDWSVVIAQYRALWAELAARRARDGVRAEEATPAPAALDPFRLYAGYPTAPLSDESVLAADRPVDAREMRALMERTGATAINRTVAQPDTFAAVQAVVLRDGPIRFGALAERVHSSRRTLEGAVLWLAKFDLIRIDPAGGGPP